MTDKKPYLLRLDADLKERADKVRGDVPFNLWVRRLIENACEKTPDSKVRFDLPLGRSPPDPGSMLKGFKRK